jgi:hypothetical protein
MYEANAEIGTPKTRGTQERYSESSTHPYSQRRDSESCQNIRAVSQRVFRAVGAGSTGWLVGKIYGRLVREAEDRLAEARACIDWYQAEEQKQLQKLEELRRELEALEAGETDTEEE